MYATNPMNCTNHDIQNQLQKVPIIELPAKPNSVDINEVNVIERVNIIMFNLVIFDLKRYSILRRF